MSELIFNLQYITQHIIIDTEHQILLVDESTQHWEF